MNFGHGLGNTENTVLSDGRRARKIERHCARCGVGIARGKRCGPCRDIVAQESRQRAYAEKKLRLQQSQPSDHQS